jgi:hypothetical protein
MATPYTTHVSDELKFDVSNVLWKSVPTFVKRLDSSRNGGSDILKAIIETYAVQFDVLKASVDNFFEAKQTSYRQYLRDLSYPFTEELYAFLVDDLGFDISPELLGSTLYEDGSNIWRNEFEKEQWSLILQNIAYFYQHRGTLEGVRSLGRIFGMSVPGNDSFLVDATNPTVTANPNWMEDWDNVNSKFALQFNRIYGDFPSPAEFSPEEQTDLVASYPNWIKWGDQIGGRFADRFVPFMDVAERGVYTNVFLPYEKDTHKNYQWITDRTLGQANYEGVYNSVAQGLKGYSLFNHPAYQLHYGTGYQRRIPSATVLGGMISHNSSLQVTFRPSTKFFFNGEDGVDYEDFVKDENYNTFEAGFTSSSTYSGFYPSSVAVTGEGSGNKVAPQTVVQMYPLVVAGKHDIDPKEFVGSTKFGGPSNALALFYFTSEFKNTWDWLSKLWWNVTDGGGLDNSDLQPWDSYNLMLDAIEASNFKTNDFAFDWWEFRDNPTPSWLQTEASNWIDLISIGPKVYMPFNISGTLWTPPVDDVGAILEPSFAVPSFDGSGLKTYATCPISFSRGWKNTAGAWTRDNNSNDPRWAYGDPSANEPMYGGGFVVSTAGQNTGAEVSNAFARCSHQAIIRTLQAELLQDYTNREGNLIKNRRIWQASDDASNWQYDNRYSNAAGTTLYPSNYENEQGLKTHHDLLAEHGLSTRYGGRPHIIQDFLINAKTPHSPVSAMSKFTNIDGEGRGTTDNSSETNPVRYTAIPDIIAPERKDLQLKVTVVFDPHAAGTGPEDAQVRWYINGMRIWYADYRFTLMGTPYDDASNSVYFNTSYQLGDLDYAGDVLAINNLPHKAANFEEPSNYSRRWWFEASNNVGTEVECSKNFWGITPDASNSTNHGYTNIFSYVQKARNPERLSHITIWNTTHSMDRDSEVSKFVSREGHSYYPYLNAQLLTDTSNQLGLYLPMTFDSRSVDYDSQPFDMYIKERMTLHDYGKLKATAPFHLYKESSNGINGVYVDLTHYGQGEVFYGESVKKYGGIQKGFLEWIFRDSIYRNQLMQHMDASRFLEDVWRSPMVSRVPEYMMDDSSNLREEFWNYRSMRPISELKKTQLIGESTDEYSSRMAKAEWMARSRHLTPSGTIAGKEIYSTGSGYNVFHSGDAWAAQSDYDALPSNPYWSNASTILKSVLASMRPDPWNFLLKYASQGINLPYHALLSSYEQSRLQVTDTEDENNRFESYAPRPIYDESHRIPTPPVVWTYGGIFMDHEGNDDSTLLGGTPTNPRENILSPLKGWLPRSAKKSWGEAPSEAWFNENSSFAIDADSYSSPHIHMHLLTSDDHVKATDLVVMPFLDPLQKDFLFIRVAKITHSINNVLFALTLTPFEGVTFGEENYRLYASIDGGLTWELVDEALPHHQNKTFISTRSILDTHVHPYGLFGSDYWIYTRYKNNAIGQDHKSWGMLSLFNSIFDYSFTGFDAITGNLPQTTNMYNSLEVPLGFMYHEPSSMADTSNVSKLIDANFLGSKHSVMDVGYGGGAVLIQGSKLGRSGTGDYNSAVKGMNNDLTEYMLAFGGAGHPFAPDFYLNTYRGSTHEYEVSNWDTDPIESVTPRPMLGHLGNRLGGGFLYGSRHMSAQYAGFPSGDWFGAKGAAEGYGHGVPRNWGYDYPAAMVDHGAYAGNGTLPIGIGGQDQPLVPMTAWPRFGAFGNIIQSYHQISEGGPISYKTSPYSMKKGLIQVGGQQFGLRLHLPYMYRGDSQYFQGEYQYTHYFDTTNGSWDILYGDSTNGLYVNDPCNRFSIANSRQGPSNHKYFNYGLNYPMTLVHLFGAPTYLEAASQRYGHRFHPYYMPSNIYPRVNYIPTLLGRDARVQNPLADDAYMNFASFIRVNHTHPDPSGMYHTTTAPAVYQGNFSQFPYLWNQWTRPINLMGGLYSRYHDIMSAWNRVVSESNYSVDDFINNYINKGFFQDVGHHPDLELLDASSHWTHPAIVDPALIKVLDVEDILQPMKWHKDNVADPRTLNRVFRVFSGFAHALTQSILTDGATPRAMAYQILPRNVYDPNEYVLGRKSFALRFKAGNDGKDWDSFRAEYNDGDLANSYHKNGFINSMEEFDTPTARLFFASAYDSDENDIYVLGGVPNTFSLGHGGFTARYLGGQTKTDVTNERNLFDNNYFMRDGVTPTNQITYLSYNQTHLLEASSPFWGGYKGMKKVSLNQSVMYLGKDATNQEVKEGHRGNMILLDVSNASDPSAAATQWLTAWGTQAHEDHYIEPNSPNQRVFGQLVYVKLRLTDVIDPSDAGTWLYYIAGTDNLTNLEIMKQQIPQGIFSGGFYNKDYAVGTNVALLKGGNTTIPNSWWLTGVPYAAHDLQYSDENPVADNSQALYDPFFQYCSLAEASNIFPYANSAFIGTSIGLQWRTREDQNNVVNYGSEASQWPIQENKWLFKNYSDADYNSYDPAEDVGLSKYHELTGPVNAIYRFQVKDVYDEWVLSWDTREASNLWSRIMFKAQEPNHGYTGENWGCIPGYIAPDWVDDAKRGLANAEFMSKSGLFDHCSVVASDGSGKKLYIFGGNTNNNGEYDLEWTDPAAYYGWGSKAPISGKGKPISIYPFGDAGHGMAPIAGIGASSSRQMYIMDFLNNNWRLGNSMPASDQKIGAARVPILWRSRGPVSKLSTLAPHPSNALEVDGITYNPVDLSVREVSNASYMYRGFSYLTGGSTPVRIPCAEVAHGGTSDHEDWNNLGPFEWVGDFPQPVKWRVGINEHTGPNFFTDQGLSELISGFIGVGGLGPVVYDFKILPEYFDFGKWKWGDDPQDYMASPMRKIRIFMDLDAPAPEGDLDKTSNMVWSHLRAIDTTNLDDTVDEYYDLDLLDPAKHVYFDTWQKVGFGNDMLLPPNPTQEWVGWNNGAAGYRGMSACVIPAADVSNYIIDTPTIGDWIIAAGGFSDGIFTPETGNTKWRDLKSTLSTRRKIANEINENLGVTLNKKIFAYRTFENEWLTIPVELPTPQVWGNVVWSSNLKSLIFHSGKQEVRTKAGIPRLITQPDDELEFGASDMDDNLIDNDNAFYNKGNLGNFAWAGLYKNWKEEDKTVGIQGRLANDLKPDVITSLMFTQPTLSMSWNPLAQIRWSGPVGERRGSYIDYMKVLPNEFQNVVNRKLGISTATGWNEVGGVETIGETLESARYSKHYSLGAMDMHWWGYPKMHDWRAGQRYRAMVAPPPSEYMGDVMENLFTDPSQSLMFNSEVDRQIWPWIMPHRVLMRLPYYVSGWNYLFHTGQTVGTIQTGQGTHDIIDADGIETSGIVKTHYRNSPYFCKYCDVMGALYPNDTGSLVSFRDLLDEVNLGPQWVTPNFELSISGGQSYMIVNQGVVKYPILGEGAGNKYADDVYTPWHSLWDNNDNNLGRSVREFGGVSFDAWIGYIHGGGESYSKGFDSFRESDRKWFPRGYDLAPSENSVFYAIGKNLFQDTWSMSIPYYQLLYSSDSHDVFNERVAKSYNVVRFIAQWATSESGYFSPQAYVNHLFPIASITDWAYGEDEETFVGGLRVNNGGEGIIRDHIVIPSDYNVFGSSDMGVEFQNAILFVGGLDKHAGDSRDGYTWGDGGLGGVFYRGEENLPRRQNYRPLANEDEAQAVFQKYYGDAGIHTVDLWRRTSGDMIVVGGDFNGYNPDVPYEAPELEGIRYLAAVLPQNGDRTIYSLGNIESTNECVNPRVNVVKNYSHPTLGETLIVAGKFKAATADNTINHPLVGDFSATGEYNNIAFLSQGQASQFIRWDNLIDTGSSLPGPSNHALYKTVELWSDSYGSSSTLRVIENDWDGWPIAGMTVFDVSNDASNHVVICGHAGVKYYDATNLRWVPMEHFEGYDPFGDSNDDYYGTFFNQLQVVDATNGDKNLFMLGTRKNLDDTYHWHWNLWKWNLTSQRWDFWSHKAGGGTETRDTMSLYTAPSNSEVFEDGLPILILSCSKREGFTPISTEKTTLIDPDGGENNIIDGTGTYYPYRIAQVGAMCNFDDYNIAVKGCNEIDFLTGAKTQNIIAYGDFKHVETWSIDLQNFSVVDVDFTTPTKHFDPWNYIRNDSVGGTQENAVPLQNVHAFTDTVDYNGVVVSGYMSPFWSALEERMMQTDINQEDPVGSQLKRFFGTENRVTQDEDGYLKFEDVWDYARWSVESGGDLGVNNIGATANVPRLILETSRKIFNNGKIFEVHFAPTQRRNVLNATEHYTHFVGFNGYYVTGLYNEDTAEYEWKSEDVFRVFADNPLEIDPALNITSIHFADNLHVTDKKGVITFKDSEETYEDTPEGKSYQWAFYPRRPIVREGAELDLNDIELFAQQAANIDPSDQQLIRQSLDFRPENAENWRPLNFEALNLEPIFNSSFVTTNEAGETEMWICGDNGMIVRSKWNDSLTNDGDYIGFSNFQIQNIDNAYARRKSIKSRLWSITDLARFAATNYDITDLARFIAGEHEISQEFVEYPSVTAVQLNSIFFIGKDTATDDNQIGKFGWAVGEQGTVLYTKDGGKNWIKTRLIDSQENIVTWAEFARDWNNGEVDISDFARLASQWDNREITCNKVVFYDTQNGFITTDKGIFKTSDGGMTWHVDKNSLTIGLTESWTDITALPERYRLWAQSLMPKVFALNTVKPAQAVDWHSNNGKATYYHKSTMGISGMPLKVEVGAKELSGTPFVDNNSEWPDSLGSSLELPSKEYSDVRPTYRKGYVFYPSNKMSLHLYDPARHIREDL